MCVFFKCLKENSETLFPHWVISDTASQFYNALIGIMDGKPIKLICTWHVDRA